ncbi:Nif3-like dinuclear metal center hexameric protein [Pelagirhabdus alkalitolerans]|nr:Nif3-like dinuclear metal center hexameric protein [Pelagirhabdus alkalitolerans]
MKIIDVINQISEGAQATQIDRDHTVDKVIIGDEFQEVTGIVTTFMATIDVIHQTIKKNANLIITHEPTWFNGRDDHHWLENDPVYKQKRQLIENHNLVIWRFHDYMHAAHEDLIYKGFNEVMNWESYQLKGDSQSKNPLERANICYAIPETTIDDLLTVIKEKLNMEVVRYIGSPQASAKRVGLLLGGSSLGLGDEKNPMKLVNSQNLDTVICGDITEWTLSAYMRDAYMMGMNKTMIILGHEKSEEVGMSNIVPWIQSLISDVPVHFVEADEPFDYFYQ